MTMKNALLVQLVLASFVTATSCKREIKGPGTPGGLSYFRFTDEAKVAMIIKGDILLQRIDLTDSSLVLASQRLFYPSFIQVFSVPSGAKMFQFTNRLSPVGERVFIVGQNRLRLVYSDKTKAPDWLDVYNATDEWINPSNVRFNGRLIQRRDVSEPVPDSYLYVLE